MGASNGKGESMAGRVIGFIENTWVFFISVLLLTFLLLPTTLLIKPQSITVVGETVVLERKVLFPIHGKWLHEFENLTQKRAALECYETGEAWYERRSEPLTFRHGCDFALYSNPGDEWMFRSCWQAIVIFNFRLRQTCLTTSFFPDASSSIVEQRAIAEELKALREEVKELKGE